MNKRDYWRLRYLQLKASSERTGIAFEASTLDEMDAIETRINEQLISWYKRFAKTNHVDFDTASQVLKKARYGDWKMTLDEFTRKAKQGGYEQELDTEYIKSQVARLEQLQMQITNSIAPVTPQITAEFEDALKQNYQDTYTHTKYLNSAMTGVTNNYAEYDDQMLKMVVSRPWQGSNFSNRVWGQFTQELPNILMSKLSEATILGYGSKKTAKQLHEAFKGFKQSNWHRLVQTEMAHAAEQATFKTYEEDDVEQYEYLATLESRTCDTCGHLDGKKFKMIDRVDGLNAPLIHPYCRCTTVPYFKDLPSANQRWSKDPITGKRKMVDDMNFDEWKKAQTNPDSVYNTAKEAKPKGSSYNWNELNIDQYNKHVNGTTAFKNYEEGRKHPVSVLTISVDEVQKLIDQYGYSKQSSTKKQIAFEHDSVIGLWTDITGKKYPTKNGRISYRNGKGAHITPMRPSYLNKGR